MAAENPANSEPRPDSSPVRFRIFLASPGDVAQDRQAVRDLVERLRGAHFLGARFQDPG